MTLLSTNLKSQTTFTQNVKGRIIDIDSKIPLIGASVLLIENNLAVVGVTTDIDGKYILKSLPIGRHSFKISFMGYEDVFLKGILIEAGKEVVLNVSMQENIAQLNDIVVTAYDDKSEAINQMTTVSANQITVESTSRIAAGISDLGRTIHCRSFHIFRQN